MNNFTVQGAIGGVVPSELGDVWLFTWPDGSVSLQIDIGSNDDPGAPRRYWSAVIDASAIPPPQRVAGREVEYERHRADNERMFGMTRRHTSDNFIFYSNADNAGKLPEMAAALESELSRISELFKFSIDETITVWYYTPQDLVTVYPDFLPNLVPGTYNGGVYWGEFYTMCVSSAIDSTGVNDMLIGLLSHELVHVFQIDMLTGAPAWIWEGTATYVGNHFNTERIIYNMLAEHVRNNNIPSLSRLEDERIFRDGGWFYYCWASAIIEFIDITWGFDKVIELHRSPADYQGIFGSSRTQFEQRWHQWLRANYR
jgi:hypothetical protein